LLTGPPLAPPLTEIGAHSEQPGLALSGARRRQGEGARPRPKGQGGSRPTTRILGTLGWILYQRGVCQRAASLLQERAAKLPDKPGCPALSRSGIQEGGRRGGRQKSPK